VYSDFRVNPASVGSATLVAGAQSSVTRNGMPTAAIGVCECERHWLGT
jgi:hypothetical protein